MKILNFLFKKEKEEIKEEPQIKIGSLIGYEGSWTPYGANVYADGGIGYVIEKLKYHYLVIKENGNFSDFPIEESYLINKEYIEKKIRIKEIGKTYNDDKGEIVNFTYGKKFIILNQDTSNFNIIKKENIIFLDIDCEKNNCKYFHNKNKICENCKNNKNIIDRYKKNKDGNKNRK